MAAQTNTLAAVSRRNRAPSPWLIGGLGIALCAMLIPLRDWGEEGYYIPLKGAAIFLSGLVPSLIMLRALRLDPEHRRANPLPYLPMVGLIYGVYFGLPVLVRDRVVFMHYIVPDVHSISRALDLALGGWWSLLLGFYVLAPRVLSRGMKRPMRLAWDPARAGSLSIVLILIGLTATFISDSMEVRGSLAQIMRVMILLLKVGIGILIILDLRTKPERWKRVVLWGVIVPLFLLISLRTGIVSQVLRQGAFVLMLVWSVRHRVSLILVTALLLSAILFRGNSYEYRTLLQNSGRVAELSMLDRSRIFIEIVRDRFVTDEEDTWQRSLDMVVNRTAQLAVLGHVVNYSPNSIPYWQGETYATLASSFIPRVIWREKPTKELGQRFGHRYRILVPGDRETSINLPQLVEFYINFGPVGVWLGMGMLGVLYRLLYQKLNQPGCGDGSILVGAVIFSDLLNIESDFSVVWGGLLQLAIVLYAILRFSKSRKTSRQGRSMSIHPVGAKS